MADEGFHEIQLNKKQLLFAFMAAALFSVVVFSLGVWVGQDVRRPDVTLAADTSPDIPVDNAPEPTKVSPDELDYAARLQSDPKAGTAATPPDNKPIEPPTPVDTATPEPPASTPKTEPAVTATKPAGAEATPPAKPGDLQLQVGAFGDAATARNLVSRLKAKGYAAFVFTAASGPLRNKVRVGPFSDRAEADKVAARLKKEEGFSPFITR
jgi:DedD protein